MAYSIRITKKNDVKKIVVPDVIEFCAGKEYFYITRMEGIGLPFKPVPRSEIETVERKNNNMDEWVEVTLRKFR